MSKNCDSIKVYVTSYNEEVTGSNNTVRIIWPNGRRCNFVIDCGLFQENEWNDYNNNLLPYEADGIDFAVVTHAHTDHVGRLPYLTKCGFSGDIYTSKETASLLPMMLHETLERMDDEFRRNVAIWQKYRKERNKHEGKKDKHLRIKEEKKLSKKQKERKEKEKQKYSSKDISHDKPHMLYGEEDITDVITQLSVKPMNETFSPCEGVEITFIPNAHLLGAVLVYCHIFDENSEVNFLATGDLGMYNRVTKLSTEIPEEIKNKVNFVICEATYGADEDPRDPVAEREKHCNIITEYLGKKKGTIMYLSNSLERPQVIAQDLKELQQDKRVEDILKDVPIYLDTTFGGICHRAYAKIIGTDYLPHNFKVIDKEQRDTVKHSKGPKIIICTSPQFYQGSFLNYGKEALENHNLAVIFAAYAPENVTSKMNLERGSKMHFAGEEVTLNCKLDQFKCYSAHIKKDQLEQFLDQFSNVKVVLFNHGVVEAKKNYEIHFKTEDRDTLAMLYGKTIVLTKDGIYKIY